MTAERREYLLSTLWAMCEREDESEAMRELETYLIATEGLVERAVPLARWTARSLVGWSEGDDAEQWLRDVRSGEQP
jgi:hypothetical protein